MHFLWLRLDGLYLLEQPRLLELDPLLDGCRQKLFDLQQVLLWREHFVLSERFLDGARFHSDHTDVLVLWEKVLILFFLSGKSVEQRLNDLCWVLEVVRFEDFEVYSLVLPELDQEWLVRLEEPVDLLEGALDLVGDIGLVGGVELVVFQPLPTVEVHLVRSLPLSANAVVPGFEHCLILVEVGVAAPSLENSQALHTVQEALIEERGELLA